MHGTDEKYVQSTGFVNVRGIVICRYRTFLLKVSLTFPGEENGAEVEYLDISERRWQQVFIILLG
jgi:hypothetical protein